MKLKDESREEEVTGMLHDQIQEKLSFSIEEALIIDNQGFLQLMKEHLVTENLLEQMAELLMLTGKSIHPLSLQSIQYLEKALLLYSYLQETSINFSFSRKDKMIEIQQLLGS